MVTKGEARTIVGIIGNIISLGLFISPIPTFKRIICDKTVGEFKPDPYLATVLNCCLWVIYGLPVVHPDSTLVITINGAGVAIEFIYVTIFFIYADWQKRRKMLLSLLIIAMFVGAMAAITFAAFHTHHKRSMFIGIVCVVFNVVMYAAPLTVMRRVIKSRSVKYMPFFLSLANLMNGLIWVAYALIKLDTYVLIPNVLGAASGILQIIIYAIFYRSTPKEDVESKRPPEVQLAGI